MKDWVRACRAQLRPGQPCPVCGNTDHHLPTDEYLSQLIATAAAHRAEAHQQWTQATAEEAALVARQGEWQKQLQQLRRQHEQAQQRLRQTQEQLQASPEAAKQADPTAEQVQEAKQLWSETETRYTTAMRAVTKLQADQADVTRRKALLEQAISHSAELQQQYRARYDAQLTDLDPYFSEASWRESWQAEPAQFQQYIEQQVARVTQWTQTRDAWQKQTEQCAGWQQQSAPYLARVRELEPEWPEPAADVPATEERSSEARLSTLPQQLAALVQRLETLQREAAELAAAADLPAEEVTAETLTEQIAAAAPTLKSLEEKYYAAQAALKADDEHRRTWSEFSRTLERLQADYALWNSLDEHFGSSDGEKFRGIAQSWTLQLLLEQTNGILRSLCPRYELLCQPGSLVILVRDLSDGGVIRVVNGVSGGETFILSLALSLALSQLNDNGLHIESLFIDEGFGSLSEGYLDNALSVLERLHSDTGGRQIGIISHVPKLRERIPVHLCVERTDSYTSRVVVRTPGGE
jgi:exonuclease SbcC